MPYKDPKKQRQYFKEYNKKWKEQHREQYRKRMREWREKNRDKVRGYSRKYYYANREKEIIRSMVGNAKRYHKLRFKAIQRYGGQCSCCGEDIFIFLSIHHVNKDGNKHRRELKKKSLNIYEWLKKENYPEGFMVLCRNCNWAESHGGCPHKDN